MRKRSTREACCSACRPDAEYPDTRAELGAGDLVLIYTDGLTEARRGEELFGAARDAPSWTGTRIGELSTSCRC